MIRREAARLVKYFDGIRAMDKYPGAMFVVDIKREHNAVAEARRLEDPRRRNRRYQLRSRPRRLPDRRQRRRHPLRAHDSGDGRPNHHSGPCRIRSQVWPPQAARGTAPRPRNLIRRQAVEVAAGDDPLQPRQARRNELRPRSKRVLRARCFGRFSLSALRSQLSTSNFN